MRKNIVSLVSVVSMAVIVGVGSRRHAISVSIATIPILREPEPQDARAAAPSEVDLLAGLTYNLFALRRTQAVGSAARRTSTTIDEVPDSSWFTNRIGTRALTIDEIVRGPNVGAPPNPSRWIIYRQKTAGAHPGITAKDANGETWFLEFDPPPNPEAATAAVVMATQVLLGLRLQPGRDVSDDVRSEAD